jgi:hypothetical protein
MRTNDDARDPPARGVVGLVETGDDHHPVASVSAIVQFKGWALLRQGTAASRSPFLVELRMTAVFSIKRSAERQCGVPAQVSTNSPSLMTAHVDRNDVVAAHHELDDEVGRHLFQC